MGENLPNGKEATPALGVTTKYDGMWKMAQKEMAENNIALYTLIREVGNNRPSP